MELSTYLLPLRKWWWLLIVATVVAAISSFLATSSQVPVYESRTTLLIGSSIEDPNPSSGELTLSQQLASIYADIVSRDTVRRATADALGLNSLPQYNAEALPNGQIVEIVVIDSNPARAQAVAQELANQLISLSPTSSPPEEQERIGFINEQLNRIQDQIQETEAEIETLQVQLGDLNSALQIQETGQQISGLQSKLTTLQSNFAALLANTELGATNTLTVLEPANLPIQPINQNALTTIFVASAIGFALAGMAAYLLEYLDKSIKTPDEVSKIFDAPVFGFIPKFPNGANEGPHVIEHSGSAITEAFRALRINIEFASTENPLKTMFLTSADASAGKTTIAINLAIMLAQGGHKVFLLDADLRRPAIHTSLGISNNIGLSNILEGEVEFRDAVQTFNSWDNLNVISAGPPPFNPAELINSERMDQVLLNLNLLADYVVIDGPPILVTDSFILASKVDGVLVVVQPGKTDRNLAVSIEEQIERVGTPIIGVVFNQVPKDSFGYYGKQWYYSPYYSSEYQSEGGKGRNTVPVPSKDRSLIPGFLAGIIGPTKNSSPKVITQPKDQPGRRDTAPLNPLLIEFSSTSTPGPPRPPKAKAILRWEESEDSWKKLVLREGDNILIGRDRINDVTIQSRHVSRRHAVITWRKNQFEIADLGSTNGTTVNGEVIEKPVELKDGDQIRLFDIELIFKLLNPSTNNPSGEENPTEVEDSLPAEESPVDSSG